MKKSQDKPTAVSLSDMARSTQRRPGRPKGSGFPHPLSVRIFHASNTVDRLLFQINESVLIQAGLTLGDACDVIFDSESQRGVIYKRDGGYSLWRNKRNSSDGRLTIPYVADSSFPAFASQTALQVLSAKGEMIAFAVPIKKNETGRAERFLEFLQNGEHPE